MSNYFDVYAAASNCHNTRIKHIQHRSISLN